MVKRVFFVLVAAWLLNFSTAWAKAKAKPDTVAGRVGVVIGAPTGMTVDFQMDGLNRIFGDLGVVSGSLALSGGWEHHVVSPWQSKNRKIRMQSLLGAGFHAHLTEGERFGLGPVIAEEISFTDTPFFVFIRFFPMLRIQPDAGFNLNANVGITFSF